VYNAAASNIIKSGILPTLSRLFLDKRLREVLRFPYHTGVMVSFDDLSFAERILNEFQTKYVFYESIYVKSNIVAKAYSYYLSGHQFGEL
jgi:hypothetical protein